MFVLSEYCYWLLNCGTNVSHYIFIPIGVNCWCLNIKMVHWLNLFFEAIKGFMITIVEIFDILSRIMLLAMKKFIVFSWNYVERANEPTIYWIMFYLFFFFLGRGLNRACKTEIFLLKDASRITYCDLVYTLNMLLKKKCAEKIYINIWI